MVAVVNRGGSFHGRKRSGGNKDFDSMMANFLKESESRLATIKHNTEESAVVVAAAGVRMNVNMMKGLRITGGRQPLFLTICAEVDEMADQLELRFRQAMSAFHLAQQPVLVAVSAGSDSMVLITLLQRLPQEERPQLAVAYVDHQLRAASQAETAYVEAYCQQHHLSLYQTQWAFTQHPKRGLKRRPGIFGTLF